MEPYKVNLQLYYGRMACECRNLLRSSSPFFHQQHENLSAALQPLGVWQNNTPMCPHAHLSRAGTGHPSIVQLKVDFVGRIAL